jgi:hypothetical protein
VAGTVYDNIKNAGASSGHFANEYLEAQIHFDFFTNPTIFASSPPDDVSKSVDISAIKLLDQLTFIDRVSDASIDVGGGPLDINKIRLPGQININPASGDVLRALPGIQLSANPDRVVANILSYRNRPAKPPTTAPFNNPFTCYNGIAGADYSAVANYPGVGIRSLAEAMIPVNDALGQSPATLDDLDKVWATIYNLCTVRSDTFVVYGYLEAIKINPRYNNPTPHNNGADWYDTASTTDDPNVATAKNLRLARLRWLAIVDRSFCNYNVSNANFQLPRVVAIKDLPR